MYLAVLVIPVPETNLEAYKAWAKNSEAIFKRYGCLDIMDGWQDFVPRGRQTDFYKAVDAQEGEKVVVSIQIWPDKATMFASEQRMHEDNALDVEGEIPFDASRLITGCFESLSNL